MRNTAMVRLATTVTAVPATVLGKDVLNITHLLNAEMIPQFVKKVD